MAYFGNAKSTSSRCARRLAGCRRGSAITAGCTHRCQVGKSYQDERDVPVPPHEAPNFVVIQSPVFGVGKIFLNMPSGSSSFHHLREGSSRRSEHEVVPLLVWIGGTAAD